MRDCVWVLWSSSAGPGLANPAGMPCRVAAFSQGCQTSEAGTLQHGCCLACKPAGVGMALLLNRSRQPPSTPTHTHTHHLTPGQYADLADLVRRCDVVTINCPLHEGTEHLFNRQLIGQGDAPGVGGLQAQSILTSTRVAQKAPLPSRTPLPSPCTPSPLPAPAAPGAQSAGLSHVHTVQPILCASR